LIIEQKRRKREGEGKKGGGHEALSNQGLFISHLPGWYGGPEKGGKKKGWLRYKKPYRRVIHRK